MVLPDVDDLSGDPPVIESVDSNLINSDNGAHTISSLVVNGNVSKMDSEIKVPKLGKNAKRKMKYKSKQSKEEQELENLTKISDRYIEKNSQQGLDKSKFQPNTYSAGGSKQVQNVSILHPLSNLSLELHNARVQIASMNSPKKDSPNKEDPLFPPYWSKEIVDKGLANGNLISGVLRINKNNYRTAYVTHPDGGTDIVIEGLLARNRSLEGDVVVLSLIPSKDQQRSGEVVFITSLEHPRTCVGTMSMQNFKKHNKYILFIPRDSRFPRLRIYRTDWPDCLLQGNIENLDKTLYYAKLTEWTNSTYGVGAIMKEVGKCGVIEVETKCILLENDLDATPHGPQMDVYYPTPPFVITENELSKRLDCRGKCIFTIDPLTAKDLDDALSCEQLPNGNFEIGVHISDVSFFLKPNTPLDEAVALKATSIYMVESVYHMLPKPLCMMCSLLPGQDRLAFSVFWEMTPEGEIIRSSFKRTVINSCTQLAYEHAQKMIESPSCTFENDDDFPEVLHNYTLGDLNKIVSQLQSIAVILRAKRFANGALRIDQPKLYFQLNSTTCLPEGFSVCEMRESNRLIEEFMLLANITVATHLYEKLPKTAFLRAHPEPQTRMLKELSDYMKTVDVILNVESSKTIQNSLKELEITLSAMDSECVMLVINNLCSRAMTRAHYFCAHRVVEEEELWHYALSVQRYTHFTSPIRRYADIIVHRQLAHVLGLQEYQHEAEKLQEVAGQCNKNKFNAKRAGEMSCELYLNHYIILNSPMVERAVVCDIKDRSLDIIVISMNLNKRIYYESFQHAKYEPIYSDNKKKVLKLNIKWDSTKTQEELVTEYVNKTTGKNSKARKKSESDRTRKNPEHSVANEECMKSDIESKLVTLTLFSKVNVVLCGNSNESQNIDAYLLPS